MRHQWILAILLAAISIPDARWVTADEMDHATRDTEPAKAAFEALHKGRTQEAIALVEAHSDWMTARNQSRYTLLHVAVRRGNVEAVRWLLEHGADVNAIAVNDFTPLHLAETLEVVAVLLEHAPDLEALSLGKTPVQTIVAELSNPGRRNEREQRLKMARMLLDAGAEYDLCTAIYLDDLPRVKEVLSAAPELVNKGGPWSPLRTAAKLGNLAICEYLVREAQADVNDIEKGSRCCSIKPRIQTLRLRVEPQWPCSLRRFVHRAMAVIVTRKKTRPRTASLQNKSLSSSRGARRSTSAQRSRSATRQRLSEC